VTCVVRAGRRARGESCTVVNTTTGNKQFSTTARCGLLLKIFAILAIRVLGHRFGRAELAVAVLQYVLLPRCSKNCQPARKIVSTDACRAVRIDNAINDSVDAQFSTDSEVIE